MNIRITELTDSRDSVNKWMERYGVRFGVYKNGVFNEQLFPFDPVPRIIGKDDWAYLEQGLKQRVQALNKFLWDVYHEKKIIKDGIVPEEFVYSSKGYMPECEQINPTGGVYAHIAGIDLVEGKRPVVCAGGQPAHTERSQLSDDCTADNASCRPIHLCLAHHRGEPGVCRPAARYDG